MVYKNSNRVTVHGLGIEIDILDGHFFNTPFPQETVPAEPELGIAQRRRNLYTLIQSNEVLDDLLLFPTAVNRVAPHER